MSSSGRPVTGFVRPGTQSRGGSLQDAFLGARPGTSRPVTSGGLVRLVRLGTASMMSQTGGKFVDLDRMDLEKYAQRPALARVLCDFIMQVEHNPKKGAELCALATKQVEFADWWWKARLGKCYYQLGQLREAEAQFKSSQKQCEVAATIMELCKVYIKMDQPNTALNTYREALERPVNASSIQLQLGIARIYEMLNDMASGVAHHRKVLQSDSSNIEAIACLASHHFYCDQPEVSLHLYKRLIQMGVDNCEIWNNLGLCCFYASQYDMCLQCFEKALLSAEGEEVAEVWYNFGQVAVGFGDLGLAYQAFKLAVSIDGAHAEALNNLGVLETQRKNLDQAKSAFHNAQQSASFLFEPFYNQALLHFKVGDFQELRHGAQGSGRLPQPRRLAGTHEAAPKPFHAAVMQNRLPRGGGSAWRGEARRIFSRGLAAPRAKNKSAVIGVSLRDLLRNSHYVSFERDGRAGGYTGRARVGSYPPPPAHCPAPPPRPAPSPPPPPPSSPS